MAGTVPSRDRLGHRLSLLEETFRVDNVWGWDSKAVPRHVAQPPAWTSPTHARAVEQANASINALETCSGHARKALPRCAYSAGKLLGVPGGICAPTTADCDHLYFMQYAHDGMDRAVVPSFPPKEKSKHISIAYVLTPVPNGFLRAPVRTHRSL
jgi:hypothetical protein